MTISKKPVLRTVLLGIFSIWIGVGQASFAQTGESGVTVFTLNERAIKQISGVFGYLHAQEGVLSEMATQRSELRPDIQH